MNIAGVQTAKGTALLSQSKGTEPSRKATVKRAHYESHDQLRHHLADFMAAYNFAHRLEALNELIPYEYIAKIWTSEPDRFIVDPIHQMPGPNND